ncbi:MAG: TorD/DmsD family molecular chaperone [Candidatus Bathyarchaeia archaeon]
MINPIAHMKGRVFRNNLTEEFLGLMDTLSEMPPFQCPPCLKLPVKLETEDEHASKVEYTRLFVSAYPRVPCPPYEAIYRTKDRHLMNEFTLQVRRFYNDFNIDLSAEFREPPDHIALELEFMYFLSHRETELWRNGNLPDASRYLRAEADFLSNHLAEWAPSLHACVNQYGKLIFYKTVTCFLEKFIKMDKVYVDRLLFNKN